ncbi:unnamed protein product [Gulo gulo]|uniref:Uncharacterized protein n=1 Tax=Gulo gulo TaxID=48420 RepID=A0A9X9M637_GULGU|nr:unnamed protein product [Gulo gulo]
MQVLLQWSVCFWCWYSLAALSSVMPENFH